MFTEDNGCGRCFAKLKSRLQSCSVDRVGDLTIQFSIDFPKEVDSELAAGLEGLLPQFTAADMRVVTH